jgi:hypothetical protein
MEKMFTKLTGSILLSALLLAGFNGKAQSTSASTATTFANAGVKSDKKSETTVAETKAAPKPAEDTTWKPQRRVWGYAFGDLYFAPHTDGGTGSRGPETNYAGVPKYRNAFQFRRVYLGYDYEITKKFKAEFLLESAPAANTGVANATNANVQNGDNLVDGKMAFYIKNINLRYRDLWKVPT